MLRVNVFDVGQANSLLFDFGRGRLGVIDCGVGRSGRNPLAEELVRRIEREPTTSILFVLFTHLDLDHINGFSDLAADQRIRGRIKRLYCGGLEFRTLWELVAAFAKKWEGASPGEALPVGKAIRSIGYINRLVEDPPSGMNLDFHGDLVSPESSDPTVYPVRLKVHEIGDEFRLWVLAPSQALRDRAVKSLRNILTEEGDSFKLIETIGFSRPDWNSASTVLLIEHRDVRILVGGDANASTWAEIFARSGERFVRCNFAIAWHHGARLGSRSGENYDEKVWGSVIHEAKGGKDPTCVVASHGCGRYGHPHDETIRSIESRGGELVCTQLREGASATPGEAREAIRILGLDTLPGLADGWEVYRQSGTACSGNVTIDITEAGRSSVKCDGPRQLGGAARPACCLEVRPGKGIGAKVNRTGDPNQEV